jgi:leader peptidase (prepilin peptidase) / N-methyltransferase
MRPARTFGAAVGGGLAFLAAGLRVEADGTELARLMILGAALGAVVASDLAEHRIPNRTVIPAAVACAGLLAAEAVPPQQLLGGTAIVAAMLAMSVVSPASFGMGDVKLALLLVVGLGGLATQALVLGLVLAGGFGAMLMLRCGRIAARRSLPLAPFLSGGAAVAVLL